METVKNVVIVCIGTSRLSGDSLGPRVGSALIRRGTCRAYVYGTEERNVTARNLGAYMEHLRLFHADSTLIAVDACLTSDERDIGSIKLLRGGLVAGSAVGLSPRKIGHIGLVGMVGILDDNPLRALANTPLHVVDSLVSGILHELEGLLVNMLSAKECGPVV